MTSKIKERIDTISHYVDIDNIKLPRSVKLELTAICNHKCIYCSLPKLQETLPIKFMTIDLYKRAVDNLESLKIQELGLFHMGEGTLHPQFNDLVKYASNKKCFEIFITTNGTKLDALKYCVEQNIKSIKFSLNGYNKKVHKEVTGIDDFESVISNLKELIAYRNFIRSKTEISASSIYYDNLEQEEFARKIADIADTFYMTQIYNHAGKVDNNFIELKNSPYLIMNMCNKPCYGLFTLGHIKVDGTINMCRFGMDHEFDIGHINEGFDKVWFGSKANEIRKKHLEDQIKTCNKCLGLSLGK